MYTVLRDFRHMKKLSVKLSRLESFLLLNPLSSDVLMEMENLAVKSTTQQVWVFVEGRMNNEWNQEGFRGTLPRVYLCRLG